jgi:hypothetical protein
MVRTLRMRTHWHQVTHAGTCSRWPMCVRARAPARSSVQTRGTRARRCGRACSPSAHATCAHIPYALAHARAPSAPPPRRRCRHPSSGPRAHGQVLQVRRCAAALTSVAAVRRFECEQRWNRAQVSRSLGVWWCAMQRRISVRYRAEGHWCRGVGNFRGHLTQWTVCGDDISCMACAVRRRQPNTP